MPLQNDPSLLLQPVSKGDSISADFENNQTEAIRQLYKKSEEAPSILNQSSTSLIPKAFLAKITEVQYLTGSSGDGKFSWCEVQNDYNTNDFVRRIGSIKSGSFSGDFYAERIDKVSSVPVQSGDIVVMYQCQDNSGKVRYEFFSTQKETFWAETLGWSGNSGSGGSGYWRSGPVEFKEVWQQGYGLYNVGIKTEVGEVGEVFVASGLATEMNNIYFNMKSSGDHILVRKTQNISGAYSYDFLNPHGYSLKYTDSGYTSGSGFASGQMLYWNPTVGKKSDPNSESKFDGLGQYVQLSLGLSGQFLKSNGSIPEWVNHSGDMSGGTYVYDSVIINSGGITNIRWDAAGHAVQFSKFISFISGYFDKWFYLDGTPV